MKAEKKQCICGTEFISTQDHCKSCQTRVDEIKLMSTEETIDALKQLLEEDERAQMEQLNMFLSCVQFLSSDYILKAIIDKMERDFEDDEIEGHLKEAAVADWDLAREMYGAWQGWW